MSEWKIVYTANADYHLHSIYHYIAYDLKNRDAANSLVIRIRKAIRNLENMPEIYKRFDSDLLKDENIRFFSVDNYDIIYMIDKVNKVVLITHITYRGRDLNRIIKYSNDLIK